MITYTTYFSVLRFHQVAVRKKDILFISKSGHVYIIFNTYHGIDGQYVSLQVVKKRFIGNGVTILSFYLIISFTSHHTG